MPGNGFHPMVKPPQADISMTLDFSLDGEAGEGACLRMEIGI